MDGDGEKRRHSPSIDSTQNYGNAGSLSDLQYYLKTFKELVSYGYDYYIYNWTLKM